MNPSNPYPRRNAAVVPLHPTHETGTTIVTPESLPVLTPAASRALMTLLRSAQVRRLDHDSATVAS